MMEEGVESCLEKRDAPDEPNLREHIEQEFKKHLDDVKSKADGSDKSINTKESQKRLASFHDQLRDDNSTLGTQVQQAIVDLQKKD